LALYQERRSISDAEFAVNVMQMDFYSALTELQFARDGFVSEPAHNKASDFAFSGGQARKSRGPILVLDKAPHDASPQLQDPDPNSVRRRPASLCDGRHRFGGFAVLRKSLILQQKLRLTLVI
jgi:hypothetical protein